MPRAGLDPELIVRRASAFIDEHGAESLTLTRLARELGVATPSLYKHIDGLDGLLTAVSAAATAELADRMGAAIRGRSRRDALEAIARAYRRFAHEHPGTYLLVQRHTNADEWAGAADDAVTAVAAALSGYGVQGCDIDRIRFVRSALHGFVDLERRGGFGLPEAVDDSFAFLIDALDATLCAEQATP